MQPSCHVTNIHFLLARLNFTLASWLSPAVLCSVQVSCFLRETSLRLMMSSNSLEWCTGTSFHLISPKFSNLALRWGVEFGGTLLDLGSWISWTVVLGGKLGMGKWLIGHTIGHETRKEDYGDLNSQTLERRKNSEKAALGSQLRAWHWIRERSPWRTSRGKRGISAFPPPPCL